MENRLDAAAIHRLPRRREEVERGAFTDQYLTTDKVGVDVPKRISVWSEVSKRIWMLMTEVSSVAFKPKKYADGGPVTTLSTESDSHSYEEWICPVANDSNKCHGTSSTWRREESKSASQKSTKEKLSGERKGEEQLDPREKLKFPMSESEKRKIRLEEEELVKEESMEDEDGASELEKSIKEMGLGERKGEQLDRREKRKSLMSESEKRKNKMKEEELVEEDARGGSEFREEYKPFLQICVRGWAAESEVEMIWFLVDIKEDRVTFLTNRQKKQSSLGAEEVVSKAELRQDMGQTLNVENCYMAATASGAAAVDRFIYRVGGFVVDHSAPRGFRLLRDVHRYDTSSPKLGWKDCPPMAIGREFPVMAVVDGKLYVMGGTSERISGVASEPWGEVFDPSLNKWEPMPSPPREYLGYQYAAAVLATDRKILLCSCDSETMLFYNVNTKSWECEPHPEFALAMKQCSEFASVVREHPPVVSGLTMYWFSRKLCVYGYDLVEQKLFSQWLEDFKIEGELDEECKVPTLLHLYDNCFCLVWEDSCLSGSGLTQIHRTSLRISRYTDSMSVLVESTHTYLVDSDFDFIDALLVVSGIEEMPQTATNIGIFAQGREIRLAASPRELWNVKF